MMQSAPLAAGSGSSDCAGSPPPRIERIHVTPVAIPLDRPVRTAVSVVTHAPLALVDVHVEGGVVGRGYVFTYNSFALKPTYDLIGSLAETLLGLPLIPASIEKQLRGSVALLGSSGLIGCAIAALDIACWDALAKVAGLPLARLLGAELRPVPAYLSVGMEGPDAAERDAAAAVAAGFTALKVKIGYRTLEEDVQAIRAAKSVLGASCMLMVDYNQSLTVPEAVRRCRALDGEGLNWIEEPVSQDDFAGMARVASEVATPIQLGENWEGSRQMASAVTAGASDLAMFDLMKIGGVSGWLRAARIAEAASLPVSSHIFQEVSAHLLCATPTADWLEYMPRLDAILRRPLRLEGGAAILEDTPGNGLDWDQAALDRFRLS
jgi:mandelate racemase